MWISIFRPRYPKWAIGHAPGGSAVYTPRLAIWARWSDWFMARCMRGAGNV